MNREPDILFECKGVAGHVILNRPHALNAVSHAMVRALAGQLDEWERDPAIARVVVSARGGRAFSAGGDLRDLYELGRAGRYDEALKFFRDEYRLNHRIKHYRKPYIALIDGIVMGGGAGISIHGSHRIAGDRFVFGMPEVGIGFFPDIGATWFLPRLPGRLGTYCALTGERLGAADAVAGGVATHRLPSSRFPELVEALSRNVPVDAVLDACSQSPSANAAMAERSAIDRLFGAERVEDILAALDREAARAASAGGLACKAAGLIRAKSPTSLKIALAQMCRGPALDFKECMRMEFRIVSRVMRGRDFYEGVRALIIDKDQAPCWHPQALEEVTADEVERYFAPLACELDLA